MVALVESLPPDSALRRGGRMWTEENELAATLIDRNEHWMSLLVQMSGKTLKDGAKPPAGIRITHPDRRERDAAADKPAKASPREVAERFKQARGR